ncbi:MAG: 3-dehydroquinate synthase [Chitinophagaceae bacterium]
MNLIEYTFSGRKVRYFLDTSFSRLKDVVSTQNMVIITDENVHRFHPELADFQLIVIPAGEQYKTQATVDTIIAQLIALEAVRKTVLVGIGGGVITDITGFTASIYMRGLSFGFVPTTILSQVDASIGGKNGIDRGLYKNMVGVIRQPDFILFDPSLLQSLPHDQWVNGFAEIIKHACIKDIGLFELLEQHRLEDFMHDSSLLTDMIKRNVVIKSNVVAADEFESGDRKLLNFGHTIGHAIENLYQLPHGHAVSIGMAWACSLSEKLNGFDTQGHERVKRLLQQYLLPTTFLLDTEKVFEVLKMDKKRVGASINFVLLNNIGEAVVKPILLSQLDTLIAET